MKNYKIDCNLESFNPDDLDILFLDLPVNDRAMHHVIRRFGKVKETKKTGMKYKKQKRGKYLTEDTHGNKVMQKLGRRKYKPVLADKKQDSVFHDKYLPDFNRKRDISWTPEEEATLSNLYPTYGPDLCSQILGRSFGSVQGKARKLGVFAESGSFKESGSKGRPWTEDEIEKLRIVLKSGTCADAAAILGRTCSSCSTKAYRLRIHEKSGENTRNHADKRFPWTLDEKFVLFKSVRNAGNIKKGCLEASKKLDNRSYSACIGAYSRYKNDVIYL